MGQGTAASLTSDSTVKGRFKVPRQGPVVLELVLELSDAFDNGLALGTLFGVLACYDGAVDVVDGACLLFLALALR